MEARRVNMGLTLTCFTVLYLVPLWCFAQAQKAPSIGGCWSVEEVVIFGNKVPADVFAKDKFCFENGEVTQTGPGGDVKYRKIYKLSLNDGIGDIDLFEREKRIGKGIVKLQDDNLIICIGEGEQDRPTDFESTEKKPYVLMRLKRPKR